MPAEPPDALIRAARPADLNAIRAIYDEAVRTSVATFDVADPSDSYWTTKLGSTDTGDHVLVAELDATIVGFAYTGAFRPRAAYSATRESSIYLTQAATGRGVGTALYRDLLARLADDGVHAVVAVVAQPNPASVALHEHCGFELVGTLREVGRKFDRWVDTRWYQLLL